MGTRIAVLIPAHNEQDYIAVTIEGVQALKNAERHFRDEPGLGAVSSNHLIKRFGTLIERRLGQRAGPVAALLLGQYLQDGLRPAYIRF